MTESCYPLVRSVSGMSFAASVALILIYSPCENFFVFPFIETQVTNLDTSDQALDHLELDRGDVLVTIPLQISVPFIISQFFCPHMCQAL